MTLSKPDITEKRPSEMIHWKPVEADKTDWMYSADSRADLERGCIGHLRGDFGHNGKEFWTSWFDHNAQLKSTSFRHELQKVVNDLRKPGRLLNCFASMSRQSKDGFPCEDSFGFKTETKDYTYFLRCIPRRGDYNFYLYAYDKNVQRRHMLENSADNPVNQQKPLKQTKHGMER